MLGFKNRLETRRDVKKHMSKANSKEDWSKRAQEVKDKNDGNFPDFWAQVVIQSGLQEKVSLSWS